MSQEEETITIQDILRHVNKRMLCLVDPILSLHKKFKNGDDNALRPLNTLVNFAGADLILESALEEGSRIGIEFMVKSMFDWLPELKIYGNRYPTEIGIGMQEYLIRLGDFFQRVDEKDILAGLYLAYDEAFGNFDTDYKPFGLIKLLSLYEGFLRRN